MKSERQELVLDQKIKLEQILTELDEAKERLIRLDEMKNSGKIERQSVYDRLKGEYTEKYENCKTEIQEEGIRSTQWIQLLNREARTLEDALESTKVRVELGELSETEAETLKKEKEQRLNKCKSCALVLDSLVTDVRSKGVQI
ncbi:MAG: hypothetical protein ACFFBD_21760 [Candidatus Hodarchaeota archaeon]